MAPQLNQLRQNIFLEIYLTYYRYFRANKLTKRVQPPSRSNNRKFHPGSRSQGYQNSRRFQPYSRPRNVFLSKDRSSTKIKIQKGGGPGLELTNTIPKLHEKTVRNEYTVACANNTIERLLDSQPNFRTSQMASAFREWQNLTSYPTILQFVRRVIIEFWPGQSTKQNNAT